MKELFKYIIGALLLGIVFSGCATTMSPEKVAEFCFNKNNEKNINKSIESYINTQNNCLYSEKITSFHEINKKMAKKYNFKIESNDISENDKKTTVVILTGSSQRWNPVANYYTGARQIKEGTQNINTYILSYPCNYKSTCNNWGKMQHTKTSYPAVNLEYVKETAEYLQKIKENENAESLVVIGHSAGGSIATTITGLFPDLIQKVIAYEGVYDWNYWFTFWESNNWKIPNVTLVNYLDSISKDTEFVLMGGTIETKAHITPPQAYNFAKKLQDHGIKVKVNIYKDETHEMHYKAWVDIVKEINKL